jgi:hypothetical protein
MSKKALLTASVLLVLVTPAPAPAHRLDGPDIVYMDGLPCNAACQSYMAWSRQQTGQPQPRHTERPSRKEARATRRAIAHRHPPTRHVVAGREDKRAPEPPAAQKTGSIEAPPPAVAVPRPAVTGPITIGAPAALAPQPAAIVQTAIQTAMETPATAPRHEDPQDATFNDRVAQMPVRERPHARTPTVGVVSLVILSSVALVAAIARRRRSAVTWHLPVAAPRR